MAKVYVSSTFIDLQEYREKVRTVLRRMGHEDVAMEYYVAEDQRPVERCLSDVAACDLYVGIFAWRYGWIPADNNPDRFSITEMEYRRASDSGKERLIFLLSEDAPWPRKFMDKDQTRIEQLRNELSARHSSGPPFTSPDDLGRLVAEAIHAWEKKHGHITARTLFPEFDLAEYYTALVKRYQRLDLDALTPPQKEEYLQLQLRSVFVEQSVRENPPPVELTKEILEKLQREKEIHPEDLPANLTLDDALRAREVYYGKPSQPVLDALTDSRHRHAIILGDPGSGKSTLSRYILLSLIGDSGDEKLRRAFDDYLPLLIELRTYAGLCAEDKCETFLEFLEHMGKTEGWHLNKDALHHHLKTDGRAVVIFDGLDEIFEPEARETVARRIAGFASDYPKARIIATSRIIGYRRKILEDAGFTHFTLQDLDEQQVVTFVDQWYSLALSDRPDEARDRRERIINSFKESASIRQLAGNPMLLTIMAIIGKHQELPRERWKLYEHAASVLIQHWDINKHLKDKDVDIDVIGEDDKKELLRRLAYKMQSGAGGLAGNYIHRDQLQEEFEGYLRERYGLPPVQAARVARTMIDQFRERNFILSLYGAHLYGFVHRAFLEYFCATAFVNRFEKTQEMTIDQLKQDVYGAHWQDRSWHEVLRLICGMIDEKFAGEIIDYLTNDLRRPWSEYSIKQPPWNIALAVQCLSEVRNLGTVAESAKQLLKILCSFFSFAMKDPNIAFRDFLADSVATSVEAIGPNWPYRNVLAILLTGLDSGDSAWLYAELFGKFVSSVGKAEEEVHRVIIDYAAHSGKNYRVLAPFTLAEGWNDDAQTLPLLHNLAVNDVDWEIRYTVLRSLEEHFRDDAQTLPLLHDRVVNDEEWAVRYIALFILGGSFRDDAQILPLLCKHVINDKEESVRSLVIAILSRYCQVDAQTLPLLQNRAVNDASKFVRGIAVEVLGNYFRDDAQTTSLLQDLAVNDKDETVRRKAAQAISPSIP
jgi:GTPase SAR1 family protein